jgi:hypothetical protein
VNYIGPFLRINTLTEENIEKHLFHFAKESFKHIVLNSGCGITLSANDLKLKNIANIDVTSFKKTNPLICIYKKANPKLIKEDHLLKWDESTFKKELPIISNAYMSLISIELSNYYEIFKEKDVKLYSLGKLYSALAKNQLDFYSSNLRNEEGVFINKKDCSNSITGEYEFEEKDKSFKYSEQALLMCAYYKLSQLPDSKTSEDYETFSLDILNMFIDFKEELYNLSFEELNKLCFAFNIFYECSKNKNAKLLLIDLCDFLIERFNESSEQYKDKAEYKALLYINLILCKKNVDIYKFDNVTENIYASLIGMYDNSKGIFIKSAKKNTMEFSSSEVLTYISALILHNKCTCSDGDNNLSNIYKRQLINSGLVLSWPEPPPISSAEKYMDYTLHSEDLLEDNCFKLPTIPTPEATELAPILIKTVEYNTKKETFTQNKVTFDSTKNMPLIFLIVYLNLNFKDKQ